MKTLFTILFSLMVLFVYPKSTFYFEPAGNEWQVSGDACYGCGNAWITVTRSAYINKYGYYEYYFWAATNSYYNNGIASNSYIENINVYYKNPETGYWEQPYQFYSYWIIVGPKAIIYTLYHQSPNIDTKITWSKILPY